MQNFISIPEPCTQNWDKMTPQEQGRFCKKCSEVVMDFSSMSNEAILAYLEKQKGNVCGRIKTSQLKTVPTLSERLKKFLYVFALVFLPFGVFGQNLIPVKQSKGSLESITLFKPGANIQSKRISGKVFNKKNEPIPFAKISLKKGSQFIATGTANLNGIFSFDSISDGRYIILVNSFGYQPFFEEIEIL